MRYQQIWTAECAVSEAGGDRPMKREEKSRISPYNKPIFVSAYRAMEWDEEAQKGKMIFLSFMLDARAESEKNKW